jgi:hypothetical protein
MVHALAAAALSLASISVPYVPQTDALCGGAAAAMVFRYWGDVHPDIDQFAPLVVRRPGGVSGIPDAALVAAVRSRGWRTETGDSTIDALRLRLAARQPVIVLLEDRRDLYHYVVVVGSDERSVAVHDPAWGPSRRIPIADFSRAWAAAHHWSLVILPEDGRPIAGRAAAGVSAGSQPAGGGNDDCDALLVQAVADVGRRGLGEADAILGAVRAACPASAGPVRELAGVRFAQKRWSDAAALARQAIALQPDDEYALDVLGSSLFMEDDPVGALRAWNRIGRPRLNLVHIEGLEHSRYQTIAEALRLKPNALVTADAFVQAKHRLEDLPDRSTAHLAVRPEADGFASVDVVIVERSGRPRGVAGWTGAAVRAGVDREASIALPGFTGQGEVWTGTWRWWNNRPRVAIGFAAPRVAGLFGVWRVEGSWEAETYAAGGAIVRESRRHGGITVSDWMTGNLRYALHAGADVWSTGRRAASVGGSLERRWLDDRLSLGGDVTAWVPVDGGRGFNAVAIRATARSSPDVRGWIYEGTGGAERVSDAAPLALWPGAGEGRARSPLLRAHPLLDAGIVDVGPGSAFGRTLMFGTAEAQRWFERARIVRVGVAAFVDVASSTRQAAGDAGARFVDVGAGLRFRVPGTSRILRVDVARGMNDGPDRPTALTVGWVF